ncbi:MAG: glycerol-3-phosphate 1-O-acyltransferase PlsY [Eubacterium sp.]|nr:glycerol-3-phosphate 1-O-acyltransferase PlsY [Eubacterium sp.]
MADRFICLVIGYIFGLFQTGYLYSKSKDFDLRSHGSGNSGTTNTIRTMGLKAGAVVFLGDVLKCVVAVVVVYFLYRNHKMVDIKLLELYTSFGVILGHDYPFYLKGKGGKGMACTGGMLLSACRFLLLPEFLIFVIPLLITRYVSLSSILVSAALPILGLIVKNMGLVSLSDEYIILLAVIGVLNIIRHRSNIVRLIHGEENKFTMGKQE